ncbi:MAG: PAS domain S-box protein, partial [Anaerolineales bacterium]
MYVNARLGAILGVSVDDLLNSSFAPYIHPDELELVTSYYNRRLAGENIPAVYETAVQRKDGERVEVEVNAGIITYQSRPADFIFVRDISERKKAEARLRSSEEQARSLVENLSDIVFIIDTDSTIKFETPSITRILGYPPGSLIGKRGLEFVHPDDLDRVWRDFEDVRLNDGNSIPSEFRVRSASGGWVPVEAVGSNRLNTPGVEGIVVTVREISARKQAELELTRLIDHNQRIVQNVTEGIVLQDTDGFITFANPAALGILGYDMGELDGKHWTTIIPKDQHAKVRAAHKRREQGETDSYELIMVRKDGRRITAWVSGVSLMEQDKFLGAMAVFSDITARKLTEMHVQRLLEQQIAVNRLALRLGNLTDPEKIFETTNEMVKSLMDADAFLVSLYDKKSRQVHFGYARAYGESFKFDDLPTIDLNGVGHGVQRAVLESGRAEIIDDYRQVSMQLQVPNEMIVQLSPGHRSMLQLIEIYTRSVLAAPMKVGGDTIGVILIHSRQKNAYDKEKSELLSAL